MCQFYNWIEDGAMVIYKDVETGAAVVLLESWVKTDSIEPSKLVFLDPLMKVKFPRHIQITVKTEAKDFEK